MTRLRVLVVGAGSVGLRVASRLAAAATGIRPCGGHGLRRVEVHNLDRLIGATPLDAAARRRKVGVAYRQMRLGLDCGQARPHGLGPDVTTPEGQRIALDYDVIFGYVDRPFPRAVLNQVDLCRLLEVDRAGGVGRVVAVGSP